MILYVKSAITPEQVEDTGLNAVLSDITDAKELVREICKDMNSNKIMDVLGEELTDDQFKMVLQPLARYWMDNAK